MTFMTYPAFIRSVQRQARAGIREDRRKMLRAARLWRAYQAAMSALGLHPLSGVEIADRLRELDHMAASVERDHRDGPTLRWAYEQEKARA